MSAPVKSHSERRQSRNKKSDPFLDLPDDLDVLKQLHDTPSPSENGKSSSSSLHNSSLLADLILTPISVISFILSLLVVERQQRQWRYQQHQSTAQPVQAQSGRWFTSPEPYQDAKGATWHPRLSWRRRGIAKMQISEVLEMRGRVVLSLALWMVIGVLGIAYAARRMYAWAFV